MIRLDKPNYYSIIPSEVRYDNSLTANAKLLYAEITSLTNKTGECWASDQYFMSLYNVSRATIQRYLKQLEDKEYITREVIYKKGTREIEKRYIKVYSFLRQGYAQNQDTPILNIETDNNTSINTTSNNIYSEVIEYLNKSTNRKYRTTKSNTKHIAARINEGYELSDFKKVIDNKVNTWKGTEFEKYLQPSTLFGTKFDNYLNENKKDKANKKDSLGVFI